MVGYNTVQGVVGQRFFLTTIEAQFLMEKLCLTLARRFYESPAATADMVIFLVSSGVDPCDVPFGYASEPTPCGCQVARPSSPSRDSDS